jgi:hypothetical protein
VGGMRHAAKRLMGAFADRRTVKEFLGPNKRDIGVQLADIYRYICQGPIRNRLCNGQERSGQSPERRGWNSYQQVSRGRAQHRR